MLPFIDKILNRITMYRLTLYYLLLLLAAAVGMAFAGILPYNPWALLFTVGFEIAACVVVNALFAKTFGVPANAESAYISALILALIITPLQSRHDMWFLGWAAVWAMASKYIVAINKKHLFNPVAFAVALTYFTINQSASWWVGNAAMLPFVLIGGLLLVRKIKKFGLVLSFMAAALATIIIFSVLGGASVGIEIQRTLAYSPLLFFAFVILTEPFTMPPTRPLQIGYGMLVGVLFVPQFHIGAFYITPEIAILIGNLFFYLVGPRRALVLRLKEKVQLAPDIYDFVFVPTRKLAFAPGQYMAWTLGHRDPDSRGNRRYFTLASSPTEDTLRVGVKYNPRGSSFKQALLTLDGCQEIVAAQVAGDFTLPADPRQKCVFIAGGIGITPFRSMVKFLLDTHQPRPIVLLYANRSAQEIVYKDVFDQAQQQLGIKTIYTVTDERTLPPFWKGRVGRITPQMIQAEIPDYLHCVFYISGSQNMVESFRAMLAQLGVSASRIKTDFFAGLA